MYCAEVMGFGVDCSGEPVAELVRCDSFAQIFTNFFSDVVCTAVPGEAAGKIVTYVFCFQVGEQIWVGWNVSCVSAFAGDADPFIGVILGVERGDF